MSLDIWLNAPEKETKHCECCGNDYEASKELYDTNITHNLGAMAKEAGIYKILWRIEETEITKASEMIEPLEKGIKLMKQDPKRFQFYNASNGWGTYSQFWKWLVDLLHACKEYPKATVHTSR